MGEWAEMAIVAPAVVDERLVVPLADHPGFYDWLMDQYALGITTGRIKTRLDLIRAEQLEAGDAQWPLWPKREIDSQRLDHKAGWEPRRATIAQSIETQGVLAKNNRLLALLRTSEELEAMMYEERNSRTGQLYLLGEYRMILDQIAKEKGELGESEGSTESRLLDLALSLSDAMKIQGSGVQQAVTNDFDYEEGEFEEISLLSEGTNLQEDGVSSE